MMSKKASHVGFVLSFVLFITSLIFFYTLIQPSFQTETEKQNTLDYLQNKVIENVTVLHKSVSVNPDISGICLDFQELRDVVEISKKIKIVDDSGNKYDGYASSDGGLVVESDSGNIDFVKIIESSSFDGIGTFSSQCSATSLSQSQYTIGQVRSEEKISVFKILELINLHKNSYSSLKDSWNVPGTVDFELIFTYSNSTEISTGSAPEVQINIYSNEESIQYINDNGVEKGGKLRIIVW